MNSSTTLDLRVHVRWGAQGTYKAQTSWGGGAEITIPKDALDAAVGELRQRYVAGATDDTRGQHEADVKRGAFDDGAGPGGSRDILLQGVPDPAGEGLATSIGSALFETLFDGQMGHVYGASRDRAATEGRRWRLVLVIEADPLGQLPWELLYDGSRRQFLACDEAVIRAPSRGGTVAPPSRAKKTRVSWVAASPRDLPPLDLDSEYKLFAAAMSTLADKRASILADRRPKVEVVRVVPPTPAALSKLLEGRGEDRAVRAGEELHILHFACHGSAPHDGGNAGEARLALEAPGGGLQWYSASGLASAIRRDPSVRLVVINACNGAQSASNDALSSIAATLCAQGVPAVIAMQTPILDAFALHLTSHLYERIAAGDPVDVALSYARRQLQVQYPTWNEKGQWASPVLWLNDEAKAAPVPTPPWLRLLLAVALVASLGVGLVEMVRRLLSDDPGVAGAGGAAGAVVVPIGTGGLAGAGGAGGGSGAGGGGGTGGAGGTGGSGTGGSGGSGGSGTGGSAVVKRTESCDTLCGELVSAIANGSSYHYGKYENITVNSEGRWSAAFRAAGLPTDSSSGQLSARPVSTSCSCTPLHKKDPG